MSFLKYSLVMVALFATAYATNAMWGKRNSTDVMVLMDFVNRTPIKDSYISMDVPFPKIDQTNNYTITGIFVYDRFWNTSGAVPTLRSGGPGYKYAVINLKSLYGQGISSTVEVWVKK